MTNSRKSLKRNIVLNCIKTIMSFIFPLITFPYVIRVLGSSGVGKVNFSSSVVSYFLILASLGVTNYAVREGVAYRDSKNKRFYNEVFTVNFISMIISYICLFIWIIISVKLHNYYQLLLIHSLSMVFTWIGVEWIFIIYEDYLQITIRSILTQLISLVLMFIFVKNENDYLIYAMVTVIASAGSYIFNYISSKRFFRPVLVSKFNFSKHIKPMFILGANTFAMTIYVNSDTTMIGYVLGDVSVGLYSTGVKVYTIVKQLMAAIISTAIPRVAYYHSREMYDERDELITNQLKLITILSLPAMVGLYFTSKDVIYILSGEGFDISIPVLKVLSFAVAFACFASIAASYGLVITKQEKTVLKGALISAFINVVLNVILIPSLGIIGAAYTTLLSEIFVFVYYTYYSSFYKYYRLIRKTILVSFVGCIPIVMICTLFNHVVDNMIVRLVLSVMLSIVVYIVVFSLFGESIFGDGFVGVLKRINTKFNRDNK